jgi:sugar lactone lactonase YvrE
MKHTFWRLSLVLVLSLGFTAPVAGAASAQPRRDAFPDRIELPTGFLPEGISVGRQPIAYLGSRADGDIYAADLRTGEGEVISQGPGTPSVGLKTNDRGLLYVAGGPAGNGRVVDIRTGAIVASYQFTRATSFVNDVVLTGRDAWFTDSAQPQLYAVPLAKNGRPAAAWFRTLPLTGDWAQTPGNNANGLTATPDGRALLVIQSSTGLLFRVDTTTGVATKVDLGDDLLTNGDGLLLRGRTLYVVQNQLNLLARVELNGSGSRGRVVDTATSPDFDVPTTVASYGRSLYLPNARFGNDSPQTADYWITRIPRF